MRVSYQEGIFGITALGFTLVMTSIKPLSICLLLMMHVGMKNDAAAFGITGLFTLLLIPQIIYSIGYSGGSGTGGFDFTPILTTLIPLFIGMLFAI